MQELTKREQMIYDFIVERISTIGKSPTTREIGDAVGLSSTSSVRHNLDNLERKGYIERDPLLKRSLRVKGWKGSTRMVPIVGEIAAGSPIVAEDNITDYIPFTGSAGGTIFALVVKGDSMINAGILSGDIAFIEKTNYVENGDIIAALIDDSATLKTFYKEDGYYRLRPENPDYEPIILQKDELYILGKIVGLTREYSYRL